MSRELRAAINAFEVIAAMPARIGPEPADDEIEEMGGKVLAGMPAKIGPEPSDDEIRQMGGKTAAAAATWAKLRDGSWGVRIPYSVGSGDKVTVEKRDGSKSTVTLGRQVWTDNKVWLFTVGSSGGSGSSSYSRGRGGRYECDECGDIVTPGTVCWETGMRH